MFRRREKKKRKVLVIWDPEAQLKIKRRWDEWEKPDGDKGHVAFHLLWQTILQCCPEAVGGKERWYIEDHGSHITLTAREEDDE